MFENFSDRGRRVVELARREAKELQHPYIGTEHVLLGILGEGPGAARDVLESFGVTPDGTRREVRELVGIGEGPAQGEAPLNPRTRAALMRANRIRLSLSSDGVEPEHLLLSLLRDEDERGIAYQLLMRHGVDTETVRAVVVRGATSPPSG